MIMQKKIILLVLLSFMALGPMSAVASRPGFRQQKSTVENLMQRHRWGDARYLLERMASELDVVEDRYDMEWVDYHRIYCDMELGAADIDKRMVRYIEEYPQSRYSNDVLFLLGSYYCGAGELELSENYLNAVEYKHLNAQQKERYDIRMGYIKFADGRYNESYPYFARIKSVSPYYHHALYFLSYIAYINKEYDVAAHGFNELVSTDDYGKLVPHYLMQIEYCTGNYDYVIGNGDALLDNASGDVRDDLVRVMAESHYKEGDYAQAIRYMSEFPAERMERQENYILGYSLYRLAMYEQAIEPLRRAADGKSDELAQNALYHLGDCYLRKGDKVHAADAFATASVEGLNEDIAEYSLLNVARLKFEIGGTFNEALTYLQSYLERYPDSPHVADVKALLIATYYNSQDYDAAYAAIKEFPNPDGEIKGALQRVAVFRAVEAIKGEEWAAADALLKESEQLNISPKYTALTLYWQGEVAYATNDMALATQKYGDYIRRAPKSEPEYLMAHYGAGYAYFAQGDMKSAEKYFENFVRDYAYRDKYMYDAHNRLGDTRYKMREFASARKAYNISVASEFPERHYATYQLAMIDGIEGKIDDKVERLKGIVMGSDGDYVDDAWYELGRTYMSVQRYEDGASTLQGFVDADTLSPYHVEALSNLGLAYYNLNRKDEARRCYERVVEYDPQSSLALEAMRSIREICVSEDCIDEYFAYAERCGVQSDMSAAARDSLTFAAAKSSYYEGNKVVATSKFKNYLDAFTNGYNRSEALFYLSDCHIEAGDNTAMTTLEELLSHGNTIYTERALVVYAPMAFDAKMYDKSAAAYRRLYDVSTDKDRRSRASDGYVESTLLVGDAATIKSMADDVVSMSNASAWACRHAMLAKANILREEESIDEAMRIYNTLASDRTTAEGIEAYYYLVLDRYNANDYVAAEQMVYDIGKAGSIYWQAKCFLLLGDVFVKLDNNFQARATYQSVVDGYTIKDDGIVDEAIERINSLEKDTINQ